MQGVGGESLRDVTTIRGLRHLMRPPLNPALELGDWKTSCPEITTFSSGCTLRSKWLMLMPSEAAASRRVRV